MSDQNFEKGKDQLETILSTISPDKETKITLYDNATSVSYSAYVDNSTSADNLDNATSVGYSAYVDNSTSADNLDNATSVGYSEYVDNSTCADHLAESSLQKSESNCFATPNQIYTVPSKMSPTYSGDTKQNIYDNYVNNKCNDQTDVLQSNIYDNSIGGTNEAPNLQNLSEEYLQIIDGRKEDMYIKILKSDDYEYATCDFRRPKPKPKTSQINIIELKVDAEYDNDADVYENDNNEESIYEPLEEEVFRSKRSWYKRLVWKVLLICVILLIGISVFAQWIYVSKQSKGIHVLYI